MLIMRYWKAAHILMATLLITDSKHLWIAACTSNEQQHSMIFQDLSQRALSQLDKHSEELELQRVSDPVISTLESIFCFIKTDILELYKP